MSNADRFIPYDQDMTSIFHDDLILLNGFVLQIVYTAKKITNAPFLAVRDFCESHWLGAAALSQQPRNSRAKRSSPPAARRRRRRALAGLATAVGAAIVLPFRLVPSFLPTPIQLLTWFLDSKSFEHRLPRLRHWMAAGGGGRRRRARRRQCGGAACWLVV